MNEVLNTLTVSGEAKDLSKVVKHFPVRAGEKSWTVKEVTAVADELIAKLSAIGVADGASVCWVDDNGADVVRPV